MRRLGRWRGGGGGRMPWLQRGGLTSVYEGIICFDQRLGY